MPLFDVYNQWPISIVKGSGSYIWDDTGKRYLDCYGGHGVISVGHNHPMWKDAIKDQLEQLSFYSNAVLQPLQNITADLLIQSSGYDGYQLFLCNSGAEANENAIKLASIYTNRSRVLALENAFHGRTSGALSATDNLTIQTPFNKPLQVDHFSSADLEVIENALKKEIYNSVIIEGIQGVAGVNEFSKELFQTIHRLCSETNTFLIIDEVQSGCGRTGSYFAHNQYEIKADIISMAKGLGNGFPVAGILISPKFEAQKGILGTTFGGNPLACSAAIAVLRIIQRENLMVHAETIGQLFKTKLAKLEQVKSVRGRGLMIGIELNLPVNQIQKMAVHAGLFTGSSSNPNVLRLLPPLTISENEAHSAIEILSEILNSPSNLL